VTRCVTINFQVTS